MTKARENKKKDVPKSTAPGRKSIRIRMMERKKQESLKINQVNKIRPVMKKAKESKRKEIPISTAPGRKSIRIRIRERKKQESLKIKQIDNFEEVNIEMVCKMAEAITKNEFMWLLGLVPVMRKPPEDGKDDTKEMILKSDDGVEEAGVANGQMEKMKQEAPDQPS